MTKRFLFQIIIGAIFFSLNISKDAIPFGKIYLKIKACKMDIEQLIKSKSLFDLQYILSEDELDEIKQLKTIYCNSNTKANK